MTQKQFNNEYKNNLPNWEVMTLTDRRLCYNDMMENYFRDGIITEKQRTSWGHPAFLESKKPSQNTQQNYDTHNK